MSTRRGFIGRLLGGLACVGVPATLGLPRLRIVSAGPRTQDITLFLNGEDISGEVPIRWEAAVRNARPGDVIELSRFARDDKGRHVCEYRVPGGWQREDGQFRPGAADPLGLTGILAYDSFRAVVVSV